MEPVVIRKALPSNLAAAIDFVRGNYMAKFNTAPETIWPDCMLAWKENQIVGVTAMQFSEGEPFEIEEQFFFDVPDLILPRTQVVSLGRWVCDVPGVSIALVTAAVQYSLQRGKERTLSCALPSLLRFLSRKYKLKYDALTAEVNWEKIPEVDRNFFLSDPPPMVYTADLRQWYDILEKSVTPEVVIEL